MYNNQKDSFELSSKKITGGKNNFFLSGDSSHNIFTNSEASKRINDYDFNLIKESAYKDISDDLLKLEYRISKSEENIKNLDMQLKAAEEIRDFNLIESLSKRAEAEKENYETLLEIYNRQSFSAKISETVSDFVAKPLKSNLKSLNTNMSELFDSLISMLPGKFSSFAVLKAAMKKLESINKSVDKLMSLNIPYGENAEKYRQLSDYIIKANSIQSEISGYLKNRG